MTIEEMRRKLRYHVEHPRCKRCGREMYVPEPPKHLQEQWGIFSWTAFVKQYVKHHGWYELENLNRNIVCGACLWDGDAPNTIILERYGEWERKYNEWSRENCASEAW